MTQSSTLVFPLLVLLCTLHSTSVIAPVNVDHSQHFPQDSSSLPACGLYVQSPDKLGLTYARPMVPLKHIGYNLEIVNGLAHITLKQQYYNPSAIFMDVYYSFSINPGSSVYKMVAQFGNKVVEGVVKQKEEARK